jgi:predicted aspartyl protease
MRIRLRDDLPYVEVVLTFREQQIRLGNVLVDTGSASIIVPADRVSEAGLYLEPDDAVHRIRGVGGSEFVFAKRVDMLSVGNLQVSDFDVEVGAMAYGFSIDGIIGMDFLLQVGAIIDLAQMQLYNSALSHEAGA